MTGSSLTVKSVATATEHWNCETYHIRKGQLVLYEYEERRRMYRVWELKYYTENFETFIHARDAFRTYTPREFEAIFKTVGNVEAYNPDEEYSKTLKEQTNA